RPLDAPAQRHALAASRPPATGRAPRAPDDDDRRASDAVGSASRGERGAPGVDRALSLAGTSRGGAGLRLVPRALFVAGNLEGAGDAPFLRQLLDRSLHRDGAQSARALAVGMVEEPEKEKRRADNDRDAAHHRALHDRP